MLPTDGRELLATWELPQMAWDTESVKTARCIIGTSRVELLDSTPLREWTLAQVAAAYGPGRYRMAPGPGPHSTKSCTVEVSEEYARREGWGSAPAVKVPTASEALAARTFHQAQSGPVDRVELAFMMEQFAARLAPPPPPPVDPFALMMKGVEFANTMNQRALDMMKGTFTGGVIEKGPTTIGDALIELAPTILDAVKALAPAILATVNRPAIAPAPIPHQPIIANPQGALPMSEPHTPAPQPMNPPALTQEEINAVSPIVGVMAPYAGMLAQRLKAHPPEEMADQLMGMLGPNLWDSVISLRDLVRKHGLAMFAHIGPNLGTPAAGIVIENLAAQIEEAISQENASGE